MIYNTLLKKVVGDKLAELGYTSKVCSTISRNGTSQKELTIKSLLINMAWFDHLTGGHTHTDFFSIRPTDYSKANEGEDFEDVW